MTEVSFWTYPGTWIAIVVAVVLVGGGIFMAVRLRRLLRKPPQLPEPPQSPPVPNTPPEKNRKPHE